MPAMHMAMSPSTPMEIPIASTTYSEAAPDLSRGGRAETMLRTHGPVAVTLQEQAAVYA